MSYRRSITTGPSAGLISLAVGVASASAAGWECVPAAAGQSVLSGGTGSVPSCPQADTAVLAPSYVSSGVGGKPTVTFSGVNVQVVSGSGSTSAAVNGEGNLVVGYAENSYNHQQSGSNDLVVGSANGWSGYGEIVGGTATRCSPRNRLAVTGHAARARANASPGRSR